MKAKKEQIDFDAKYCPLCGAHEFEHGEQETPHRDFIIQASNAYEEMLHLLKRIRSNRHYTPCKAIYLEELDRTISKAEGLDNEKA